MNLLNFSERRRKTWHIARLAQDIARRTKMSVWQRAMPQLMKMNFAEARGYLRARAGEPVRQMMNEIVDRYADSDAGMVEQIFSQAIDEVIHQVVRELSKSARPAEAKHKAA